MENIVQELQELNQNLQTLGFLKELEVRVAIDALAVKVSPGNFGLRSKSFDDYKQDILTELAKNKIPIDTPQ